MRFYRTSLQAMLGALALLGEAPGAAAWGADGHEITAQVAEAMLTSEEVSRAHSILGGHNLASVSTWADDIRSKHSWRWSEGLHFINTPDGSCSFNYARDCKDEHGVEGNCVAGAILNYTSQLMNSGSKGDLQIALKFVIHFVGDIHQPLHVGWTSDRGGNSVDVEESWEKDEHRNLHAVWDSGLIDGIKHETGLNQTGLAKKWAEELKSGDLQQNFTAWSHCLSSESESGLKSCVEEIASESIKDACTYAYVDAEGHKVKKGEDLNEAYFKTRAPIVKSRLAAGGVRLAMIVKYALKASERVLLV